MNVHADNQNYMVSDVHDGKHLRMPAEAAEDGAMHCDIDINNSFIKSGEQAQDKDNESCSAPEQTTKPTTESSSPRNAWGNSSYADLITRAIMSSPNARMTLQEIYAWISDNIPYFMDKKNSPTTNGWKNSVRHTLSIRKSFVRVRNTEYGSLNYKNQWTIDPQQETRKRSRGRRDEGRPSMSYTNLRYLHTINDTRISAMTNGMIYERSNLKEQVSCCPCCERHSSFSVALPYQPGLSYYGYRS